MPPTPKGGYRTVNVEPHPKGESNRTGSPLTANRQLLVVAFDC